MIEEIVKFIVFILIQFAAGIVFNLDKRNTEVYWYAVGTFICCATIVGFIVQIVVHYIK